MNLAMTISPFKSVNVYDDWISWRKDMPLTDLQANNNTDCRYGAADEMSAEDIISVQSALHTNMISRSRYNAVVEKFSQANMKTGKFVSWT